MTTQPDRLYSTADLARATGYSVGRIRLFHKQGLIHPCTIIGEEQRLYNKETVDALIQRRAEYLAFVERQVATAKARPAA